MANDTNPFGDISTLMTQFKLPGVDVPAIVEASRKDIEALVEANKAAFESMKALGAKQGQMFKEAMQGIQDSAKSASHGVGLGDPAKQAELVRKAFEKSISDMTELAEMTRQSQADTMAHLTRRANEHVDEIKKLMAPK